MLSEVKAGTFMPDAPRGQEFSDPPDPVPGAAPGVELGQDDMESSSCPSADRRRLTIQVTKHSSNKSLNGVARWTLIVSTVSTPSLGTSNPGSYMF